jgi:ADP-ribose pyrophosphatase YjhB (NUDIX family)
VAVAILDDNRILLIKREDFEVWALPGGGVDAGESLAQAAVREAREETGLRVSLTRLVGVYSRPHWDHGGDHVVLFAAAPIGGILLQDAKGDREVLDARYFARHELPEALVPWHRQRVCDALDGVGGGVAWSHTAIWPFAQGMTREELYDLRDRSGLSRQQFYALYLACTMKEAYLDVGDG